MALTKEDLEAISQLLQPIHQRLDKVDQRLDKVDQRLDKVDQRLDTMDEQRKASAIKAKQNMKEMESRLTKHTEDSIAKLKAKFKNS